MFYPRFIRETVAVLRERYEKIKKRKEQRPIKNWIIDNIFIPYYIDGWYKTYNHTDTELLKIEVLREHIKWWTRERKEREFFLQNNNAANKCCILCPFYKEELNVPFKKAFPWAKHDLEYYIQNIHYNWRFDIEDRMRETIF